MQSTSLYKIFLFICCGYFYQIAQSATNDSLFAKAFKKLQRGPPDLPTTRIAPVLTKWVEQKLDNFNESETRSWRMRYMENREFFEAGGPMFIHVGGEWEITPDKITDGIIVDMAREHKGILFYTEHRFYGKSMPLNFATVDNLKYLHVKQALADLANFIKSQRKVDPALAKSKVIMSGGSYSATMVVWFKKLYPDLLDGGFASSAPLYAKVDFAEYKEVVGRAIRELGGEQCYERVKRGISELESMVNDSRVAEFKAMLKLCNNFDHHNDLDVWNIFDALSNLFSGVIQYQKKNDVSNLCDYLMSFDTDVEALANFWLKNLDEGELCLDGSYKDSLQFLMDTTYKNGAARPWIYQTCNEYGWYQTSTSKNQPFGSKFPVTYSTNLCSDVYGAKFTMKFIHEQVAATNDEFGGFIPDVENVYMTHGGLDPWHPMGQGADQGATIIPQASHCTDFGSISSTDSEELRSSKQRLTQLVRKWLA